MIPINPLPGLIQGCLFHVKKILKIKPWVPVDVTEGQPVEVNTLPIQIDHLSVQIG